MSNKGKCKKCRECFYFRHLITVDRIVDGCVCIMFRGEVEIDEDTDAMDCEEFKEHKKL